MTDEQRRTIVTDYFVAASDDVAAMALLDPEGPAAVAEGSGKPLFDTVRLPAIEPFVMLGSLHALLSGRSYRECTADGRHGLVVGGHEEGPWVVAVSEGLVEALARAPRQRLVEVAARWARAPEVGARARRPGTAPPLERPDRLPAAVSSLAALARRAVAVRQTLYCWTQLP